MANVVFLWHMHQPYYVDPATRTATMPWVRLHCVKGYLDMVSVIEDFPSVRVNFNLTPVLMLQVKELIEGRIRDAWLDLSRRPAADLDDAERYSLLENFFKIHWDNLIRPFPRYWELLNKRGLTFYPDEVRRGLRYFSTQEFLDLQVWFNLAWCGYTALRLRPELAELRRKGRGFTEEEKNRVLDIHLELMREVILRYAGAEGRGQAELCTTPFFHPILPLVYDSALAERSLPGRAWPCRFHWPQDAAAQLTLAVDQHAAMFGQPPRGLWPSEGSIAPELIPLMEASGIRYFCSDEEILFHSLRSDPARRAAAPDRLELFQGWRVEHEGAHVNALFREKPLSDFIGFMAAKNDAAAAASHLLHHLANIAAAVPKDTGVIPLILDGENAWETFADGGEAFLRALYGGIEARRETLHSCTIEDYFNHHPPKRAITTLHTGSWIGSSFGIWIGDEEENRAWDLLGTTREFLEEQIAAGHLSEDARCAALREIYAAEGSDWFWWYGEDFTTDNDRLFDELFRSHLRHVYTLCDEVPPAVLSRPVTLRTSIAALFKPPSAMVTPHIDGRRASYFEWSGAGEYQAGGEGSTMHRGERLLERFFFGNDEHMFYFRCDLARLEPVSLRLEFREPLVIAVETAPLVRGVQLQYTLRRAGAPPLSKKGVAAHDVVELAIPLADLGFGAKGGRVSFNVRLLRDGLETERYPEAAPIQSVLPGEEWALEHWRV